MGREKRGIRGHGECKRYTRGEMRSSISLMNSKIGNA